MTRSAGVAETASIDGRRAMAVAVGCGLWETNALTQECTDAETGMHVGTNVQTQCTGEKKADRRMATHLTQSVAALSPSNVSRA